MDEMFVLQFTMVLRLKGFLTLTNDQDCVDLWMFEGKFSDGRRVYGDYLVEKSCHLFFQKREGDCNDIPDVVNIKKVVSDFLRWPLCENNPSQIRRGDVGLKLGKNYGLLTWEK